MANIMEKSDGHPKNYSSEDKEDMKPPLPMRPATRNSKLYKLDGALATPAHRELNGRDFLKTLYAKLQPYSISTEQPDQLGIDTLNRHYESVFPMRRGKLENQANEFKGEYRVYISYFKYDANGVKCPRDTPYSIKTNANKLRSVKAKTPFNRPDYRYFFKDNQNVYQEIDNDNDSVPYFESKNSRTIHCHVIMP